MNARQREEIFKRFQAASPHPTTVFVYTTFFELLIAVILSAQATDVSVNKAMRKLFPIANTPAQIYALGVDGLIPYVQNINLYRNKAKYVVETCRLLLSRHNGGGPRARGGGGAGPGGGRGAAGGGLN